MVPSKILIDPPSLLSNGSMGLLFSFASLSEVKNIAQQWREIYNQDQPHESLDGLALPVFAERRQKNFVDILKDSTSR